MKYLQANRDVVYDTLFPEKSPMQNKLSKSIHVSLRETMYRILYRPLLDIENIYLLLNDL